MAGQRRLLLLDLSNNNTVATLQHARSAGIVGCWLKVGEGNTWIDPTYHRLRTLAHDAGLRAGGYWFARPGAGNAADQARRFADALGVIGRRDLRPVLDIEVPATAGSNIELGAWAQTFLQTFRKLSGVCALTYSYSSYLAAMQLQRPLGCGLWLAGYGRNDGTEYPYVVPAPWHKAVAHQFTSRGHVPGISGDVDISSARSLRPLLARGILGL